MAETTEIPGYVNVTDVRDTQYDYQSAAYDNYIFMARAVYWSLMTLLVMTGIVGNSLVIYVIMTRQAMRNMFNLLLVNLAVADLMLLITWSAFSIIFFLLTYSNLHLAKYIAYIDINGYIFGLSVYVSVYTLTLIAVVRYLVVAYPHKSKRFVARKPVGVILAVIWTGSFIFGTFKVSWFSIASPCYVRSVRFFTVFAYVLPLSVIATLSILTFRRLKQPLGISGSEGQNRNKKKAARLLVIIVVVFAVSWLPYHIRFTMSYYPFSCLANSPVPGGIWFFLFGPNLALSNSCVNPIIYNLASTTFRQHFRDALCCRRERRSATNRPIALV